jgi:hypothetical protein
MNLSVGIRIHQLLISFLDVSLAPKDGLHPLILDEDKILKLGAKLSSNT